MLVAILSCLYSTSLPDSAIPALWLLLHTSQSDVSHLITEAEINIEFCES